MRNTILQALARGYCTPENECKELDSTLISAMADEVMKIIDEPETKEEPVNPYILDTAELRRTEELRNRM